MKIRILGSGTSTGIPEPRCKCEVCRSTNPKDNRLRCSILVEEKGKHILIDCSPDFRQQVLTYHIEQIDALLITHEHYDHIGGLDDLRPFCNSYQLPIYLEKRVIEKLKLSMHYCFSENPYPGVPNLFLNEISTKPFNIDNVEIIPIRAMHYTLPILGYRIGKIAYITDMRTIPNAEMSKLEGVDILIVNALRIIEHISHQNLSQALDFIKTIAPKQAYLTHLSHQMGLHDIISQQLPPNVQIAYDGMEINL